MDQLDRTEIQLLERDRQFEQGQEMQLQTELEEKQIEIYRLSESIHRDVEERNRGNLFYDEEDQEDYEDTLRQYVDNMDDRNGGDMLYDKEDQEYYEEDMQI